MASATVITTGDWRTLSTGLGNELLTERPLPPGDCAITTGALRTLSIGEGGNKLIASTGTGIIEGILWLNEQFQLTVEWFQYPNHSNLLPVI